MEAPEKIYQQENTAAYGKFCPEWIEEREKDSDIEYICKDAFIEKACKFIKERLFFEDSWHVDDEDCILDKVIRDFKSYMKEE